VKPATLAAIILASAVCGLAQPAENKTEDKLVARHVIGLEKVKRNHSGTLTIQSGELGFASGKTSDKFPIASIDDLVLGTETTQSGGKTGRAVKTAAIAAPYESGAGLSILLRTKVDVLTVSYRESGGGLHYAILAMPKGKGEQERSQLIAAGARVKTPPAPVLKEARATAAEPAKAAVQAPIQKITASAIQIQPVDSGDVQIPAEFLAAVYEFVVIRVRESGAFEHVYRSGDRAAESVPDLVTLHLEVEKFTQGSQMKREITTVLGATKVDLAATLTAHDGKTLLDRKVHGKVRFFGENLGVTNDLAKRIAKLLHRT
jgi:hypothetical protein